MPERIYHTTAQCLIARNQHLHLLAFSDDGCAMFSTDMKRELGGICPIRRMTIHTVGVHMLILNDWLLLEVAQITLVEAHRAVSLIAWRDKTVGNAPLSQRIIADEYWERLVSRPLTVFLDGDSDLQTVTSVLLYQRMPLIHVKVCIVSIGMKLVAILTADHDIHQIHLLILDIEIQRGDVGRDGNSDIVWRYLGPGIALDGVLGQRCATAESKHCKR